MGFECWCCAAQRTVVLGGRIVGRRAADVLKVTGCKVRECAFRKNPDCLIGREVEGRW